MRNVRSIAVAAVAAVLGALAAVPTADAHRANCWIGSSFAAGDARKVYAIPHGCSWIYKPRTRRTEPVVMTRIHGRSVGHRLPHEPLGSARGICGVSGFVVDWPVVFVATDAPWYERFGRNECVSSFDAAPMWLMRWRDGRFDRVFFSPARPD